jgi:hypothetical protein
MNTLRSGLIGLFLLCGASACQGRETEEARAFLAAYGAVDHNAPEAERSQRIAALSALVITAKGIAQTRDECVKAHQALLDSEGAQERAARALDAALGDAGGAPLPADQTSAIQSVIGAAEKALAEARRRFATCEAEARDLALRYGKR